MGTLIRPTYRRPSVLRWCVLGATFVSTATNAQFRLPPQPQVPSALSGALNLRSPKPTPTLNPKYDSKAAFLAAAQRGELINYMGSNEKNDPILDSIEVIVGKEYGTPIPITNSTDCNRGVLRTELSDVLERITLDKSRTRSDNPPDFVRDHHPVSNGTDPMAGIRNSCYIGSVLNHVPQPVVNSLDKLLTEYALATQQFVDAERTAKRQQYQEEQRQQQAALAQRQAEEQEEQRLQAEALAKKRAEEKALEQKRIDTERQRIEEEDKKAKEREAQQVSG